MFNLNQYFLYGIRISIMIVNNYRYLLIFSEIYTRYLIFTIQNIAHYMSNYY